MTRGYRAVSTREIAEAVGITQPALYHHFGGKEALYAAVLEADLARQAETIREATRADASAPERLRRLATSIAAQADHDLGQMFHDLRFEVSEPTRRRMGLAFRDAMMAPMADLVDALVGEGAIAPPETSGMAPPEVAMFILSVIRMLQEGSAGPGRGPGRAPEEIGDLTVRLVLHGAGPR
jgi:AcrR family transcriptional regulator